MPNITYKGEQVTSNEGESVLSALLREGHAIPNSCQSGVCQSCMMKAESGEVPKQATQGIQDTLAEQGYFLSCVCKPKGDLVVNDVGEGLQADVIVQELEFVSDSVLRIRLKPVTEFKYRAGQFVSVLRDDNLSRSYSIASLPSDEYVELQVRVLPDGKMSQWMANDMKVGDHLTLKGPFGNCFYTATDLDKPLILAGTGTGLAPLQGVLRDALAHQHRGPITLLHGGRNYSGLYNQDLLKLIEEENQQVSYAPCVLDGEGACDKTIERPLDEVVAELGAKHPGARAFLCGNPELVQKMQMDLFLAGISPMEIMVDAFVPGKS